MLACGNADGYTRSRRGGRYVPYTQSRISSATVTFQLAWRRAVLSLVSCGSSARISGMSCCWLRARRRRSKSLVWSSSDGGSMSSGNRRTAGFCRQSQLMGSDSGSATAWPCGRTCSFLRWGTSTSTDPLMKVWHATAQPSRISVVSSPALLRRSTSPLVTRTRQRPQRPCPAHGALTSSSQRTAASSSVVPSGTSTVSPDGEKVMVAMVRLAATGASSTVTPRSRRRSRLAVRQSLDLDGRLRRSTRS